MISTTELKLQHHNSKKDNFMDSQSQSQNPLDTQISLTLFFPLEYILHKNLLNKIFPILKIHPLNSLITVGMFLSKI